MIADWILEHIARLNSGQITQLRISEQFLEPQFTPNQLVTLQQPTSGSVSVDDLVLVSLNDNAYFALVKGFVNGQFLIGNNNGLIFGVVDESAILGRAILIQD